MKNLKLSNVDTVGNLGGISVRVCHVTAGSCNACSNSKSNVIYEISLKSLLFRLCYNCKNILVSKFRSY